MQPPLLAELKRRRVFRALIAYGIAAFAVLQIIEPLMHGLRWPEATLSYVVVALAAGFPVVVALAWIFDVNAGRIERTAAPGPQRIKGATLALVLAGLGLFCAAPGLLWYFVWRPPARAADRSIAVLPFTSLSAGEESKYFADAIHIELLGQLAKVSDLKVISRTSVLQYKDGAKNAREIGEALGVSSVLEGSVQRAGNRVRVQVELIDARRDRQIWADRYDRDLTDLFAIETAVAEDISKALQAQLSPDERGQIARRPTANAEAYALYLRALEYDNRPPIDNLHQAEQLYRRALDLDPQFALAHARLSFLHSRAFWWNVDHSAARLLQAKEEAQRALALQPDLAEAHSAQGFVYYWGSRDYDRALQEFNIARKSVPEVVAYIGYVQRRQGRFEEAVRSLAQAQELDPRSTRVQAEQVNTLLMLRRYAEAEQAIDRLAAIAPELPDSSIFRAALRLLRDGEIGPARDVVRGLAERTSGAGTWWIHAFVDDVLVFDPAHALAAISSAPQAIGGWLSRRLVSATAREALGQSAEARADYEAARIELEAAVRDEPDDGLRRAALGEAYAGVGRKEDALREARRAVELLPVSKDAFTGPVLLEQLAATEARLGQADAAIEHLRTLLAIPSRVSVPLLRIDPRWAPLRSHPRFQELIRDARVAVP